MIVALKPVIASLKILRQLVGCEDVEHAHRRRSRYGGLAGFDRVHRVGVDAQVKLPAMNSAIHGPGRPAARRRPASGSNVARWFFLEDAQAGQRAQHTV